MYTLRSLLIALVCGLTIGLSPAGAQSSADYDASWYEPDQPHVQIDVTTDGVYRVSGSTLDDALPDGSALSDVTRKTIRLYENGTEIPIQVTGDPEGSLTASDRITFVGRRNRGDDEHWAYNYSRDYDQRAQSSTYYSLYSDTTTYWMTWGGREGKRYRQRSSSSSTSPTAALRDTLHAEQDNFYYFGRPDENGNSLYTFSEGYFWRRFSHSSTSSISFTHTLAVDRRADTATDLDLSIRLTGATSANDSDGASCHRVEVEARLRQSTGSPSFESLTTVEWKDLDRQTIATTVQQDRIPAGGLDLRLTSYNSGFSSSGCADPASTLNRVLLDWIEAAYTRSLEATNNTQRFAAPTAGEQSFALSGYAETETIRVYNPLDSTRYALSATNGCATLTATPSTAGAPYWAVGSGGFRSPAALRPDAPSNWSAPSNAADYLILTTRALRPSAQNLAEHRRTEAGGDYEVEIATVQNVFDEFDYGRPTPIAIRRFVRASQAWDTPPQFLAIFGDAQYPIDDGTISSLYPEWSVPSFGFSPSDGWFAMQTGGEEDWSEVLAVGRIPVRSVAQGNLFVEKLKNYETAPLERWQKRMLLLAGGTSASEQRVLQNYSNRWGEIAADTFATTRNYTGPVHTGMDTSRYYKNINDALDTSFQDSLAVDLKRGAGWLNYFGHSAAQTWEIVTDPPSEFDNAGRLPIVSSIGCRTGSFAGVRVGDKSLPSLGEQLVVGSTRPDGTPRDGARNGAIAHFGESALGFRTPSARINDALVRRVFVDTMRVLGEAIRQGKAEINREFEGNDFYRKHLLQYGLLGDPATQMNLPAKPDLRVASSLISITPSAPTPSDELNVSVRIQNQGLIPSDSVDVRLVWEKPDGASVQRSRRLPRFALQQTLSFSFSLSEQALGPNTFRVQVDPGNEYGEINETNNEAERTTTVFSSGVELISPADQGIVSSPTPSLLFTLSRQEKEAERVILQLDSLPSFDSPALQTTTVEMSEFRETWTPRSLQDAKSYFWRGRLATADDSNWKTSRFTVRTDRSRGNWLQRGRLFQDNRNDRMTWTPESGWRYGDFTRSVRITSEPGGVLGAEGTITVGTDDYEFRTLGFGIVVIDGTTGAVKKHESFCTYDVSDGTLNERRCGGGVDGEAAADLLDNFLQSVDTGDYVLVRTRHLARSGPADISPRVKNLFRTLGGETSPHSSAIDTLRYDDVWALQARKGFPEETVEKAIEASGSELQQRTTLSFRFPDGKTVTTRIGPASQWTSLEWDLTSSPTDDVQFEVLAADSSRLLQQRASQDGSLSLETIDPTAHPYLRLRATLTDSTNRTPPQLNVWSVSYDGAPELALDPSTLQSIPDTVEQGRSVSASIPVYNLGSTESAPVRVRHDLTDASNVTSRVKRDTLKGLSPGARDTSSVTLSTADRPGPNQLTVTAASDGPPERFRANNTALRNFTVRADDTPPSLKILTNGRTLPPTSSSVQNLKDSSLPFVSTQPTFEITLRDDNPYLTLDDTSHVSVYLKDGLPSTDPSVISDFERVSFSGDALTFVSASEDSSTAWQARFTPALPATDSTYTLKVEAEDEKGNEIDPYQTTFRIQQNQEIKDVYPYPNPMSAHTTFAFRVVGGRNESEALRDFTLRIYTLSGRLVREFDRSDISPLGPDWYGVRWNGRDEDGDRVATGTYLYQADVSGTGDSFEGDVEKVTVIR